MIINGKTWIFIFFNDEDAIDEKKYLRTCKRSNISKEIHCLKKENNQKENLYFSQSYLNYLLNNMIGLTPLWCDALLGDIGRHGDREAYINWSNNFRQRKCITSLTKTPRNHREV